MTAPISTRVRPSPSCTPFCVLNQPTWRSAAPTSGTDNRCSPAPERRPRVPHPFFAPAGCRPTSPFAALSELIQGWDESTVRRIVILISNGMDPEVKPGYSSDSAEAALALAQRAGVVIFAIYHPASRYEVLPFGTVYSGQVLLSHLAFESGGQGYFAGAGPLDSIAPFLSDIAAAWNININWSSC
jgi:hypothetical protein